MKFRTLLYTALTLAVSASSIHAQTVPQVEKAANAVRPAQVTNEDPLSTLSRAFITPTGKVVRPPTVTADTTLAPASSPSFTGDITNTVNSTGGNLGAKSTYTGVVNSSLVPIATLTNGTATAKTKSLMDDTPAAEFSAVTVGVAPTDTQDATVARKGTNSLKLAWPATSVAGDGVAWTAFSGEDWTTEESVGFWIYVSEPIAAGDLTFVIVDSTADHAFNIPAVTVPNKWVWVEVDISVLATTDGDAVTNYKLLLSTAGAAAHGAFSTYFDGGWKWDATEEVALSLDLVDSPGAVRTFLTQVKTDAGTTAHTWTKQAEDTDFFVHSEDGVDFLVTITDLSTFTGFVLVNHKE